MPGRAAGPDAGSARAAPPADLLAIEGLKHSYGATAVLKGIDLALAPGRVTALLGPNGAGKTTLVKAICGRLKPQSGTVRLCGILATDSAARRLIGLAPQEIALYRPLTVAENLAVFTRLAGVPWRTVPTRVDEVTRMTGLAAHRDLRIDQMSGGWQRRVNLAAALVGHPRLLALDEPTVGVDAPAREALAGLIRDLAAAGMGILLVTHDFAFAEAAADRLAVLSDGRIVLEGALPDLLASQFAHRRAADVTFAKAPPAAARQVLAEAGLKPHGHALAYHGLIGDEARCASALFAALEALGAPPRTLALDAPGLDALYESVIGNAAAEGPP